MSTRSRRSLGGDTEGIHPTRIPLYPVSRLKEELQKRNLPTNGSKDDLIYRLIDALEGNAPQEVVATPQKPPARGRKVVVKTEPVEETVPIIKQETPEEDKQPKKTTPKRTPAKRARKVKQEPEPTEESDQEPEPVETPKSPEKKKIRIKEEPLDEEEHRPKKKKSRKSVEEVEVPSTSSHQKTPSPQKEVEPPAPQPMEEALNEDVPLLSLLSRKKVTVKTEIVEEETDSLSQKPTHSHGTRRAKAILTVQQSTVVVEQKRFIEHLSGDVFDDDDSHDYVPPETSSHRRESREEPIQREKVTKQRSEEERPKDRVKKPSISTRPVKVEPLPPPRPPQKTTVSLWTEKMAQMKKDQQQQREAEQKPVIGAKPVSRTTSETKSLKPARPAQVMSNPLDDILTKQAQAELEARRKKEEEERSAREDEQRRREKMAEYRRRKAEEDAKRVERLKTLPPGALKPKPVAEPKMVEQKIHPYAIPQPILQTTPSPAPVKPAPSIQTTPKITPIIQANVTPVARGQPLPKPGLVIPQRIGPPPPPPKREKVIGEMAGSTSPASTVTSATSQKLPPPPPPPRKASQLPAPQPSTSQATVSHPPVGPPPPPPPRRPKRETGMVKAEPRSESTEKSGRENEENGRDTSSQEENATPTEGDVDPTLVSSITEALLKVMQQHSGAETKPLVEKSPKVSEKPVENMDSSPISPESPERSGDREPGEEPPYEEYDPFGTTAIDLDVSAYIPSTIVSRNQTMMEEESEEEPSDDEVRGEIEDDEESDEDESEDEISSQAVKKSAQTSPHKRATAGRDMESLFQNPRDLLMKANAVIFSNTDESTEGPQYVQMPSARDYEPEDEGKKTPEYHGEPVPSDDDIDFFELGAGIQKPKKKKDVVIEEEKLPSDESIEPDYYNADLHIKGATDRNWRIEPENADGLAIMWGGVKSTYGIRLPFRDVRNQTSDTDETMEIDGEAPAKQNSKKIAFQIKIAEFLSTKHLPFEEMDPHDVRVGFSLRSAPNALGEYPNSWCITSLGKKATNNFFSDFGNAFHLNDVITACIDLEECNISYWKNDEYLGVAFSSITLPDGEALFPHVCIKNCSVVVNLGEFKGDDEDHPWRRKDDWRFMTALGRGDLERSLKSPESKTQCTVIMMVGLPGVGKTTWVREYLRDHPEEHWTVINTESVLSAMKVNGISRQRAHQGRWDMIMGLIGKSLQRSVLLAARRRKNYILDMTNTSRDTRKKRLQLFEEFQRKCVIIMPSDEDILDRQARQARQEGTALMPPEAMLEMKAVISLPAQDQEPFEDIYFIEPQIHRVQDCIDQINRYNEEARPWFQKKYKRRRSQMIGLGDGIPRDPMMPRKPVQPLTVLPQLKVAVVPLDDPSSQPMSANGSLGSGPKSASALGFTVVEDRTPTRPPVAISIDTSIPPPQIMLSGKPLVRVTIEDIPSTAVPAPFIRRSSGAGGTSVDDQAAELTEQELKELREAVKAANPSGNPMMSEAIMRSRLKALQLKRQEKRSAVNTTPRAEPAMSLPSTPVVTAPPPTPITGTPISVIGGRSIPTIGGRNSLSIDTSQIHTSFPSTSNSNSPRISAPSPNVSLSLPPPGLAAPYLSTQPRQQNGFSQPPPMSPQIPMQIPVTMSAVMPPTSYSPFNQPPPALGNFQANMNVPPPTMFQNNGIPNSTGYSPATLAYPK